MNSSGLETSKGAQGLWSEFWRLGEARANVPGIHARVTLAQPALENQAICRGNGQRSSFPGR